MTDKERLKYNDKCIKLLALQIKYSDDLKKYGKYKTRLTSYKQGFVSGFEKGWEYMFSNEKTREETDEDIALEKQLNADEIKRNELKLKRNRAYPQKANFYNKNNNKQSKKI